MPRDPGVMTRPTPLLNSRASRTRPGIRQLDLRFGGANRRRRAASKTTTTAVPTELNTSTTTTTAPAAVQGPSAALGPYMQFIEGKLIRFLVACPDCHTEMAALVASVPIEEVLTQLCVQLLQSSHLHPGMSFRVSDRAFSDHDAGFSVYFCTHDGTTSRHAWIDALQFGLEPFATPLPLLFTEDALQDRCGDRLLANTHITINGVPWSGDAKPLEHGDVVVAPPRHSSFLFCTYRCH